MYGIDKDFREPRRYTLDVLALYLGYKDWASLPEVNEIDERVESPHLNVNDIRGVILETAPENETDEVVVQISGMVNNQVKIKKRFIFFIALVGVPLLAYGVIKFFKTENTNEVDADQYKLNNKMNLSNGLVAYYPFDGNANDVSGNQNNGTVYGATLATDRFGKAKKAYSFNGVSNYILLPVLTTLPNSNQVTFSIWIKTAYNFKTPDGSACIFDQWSFTNPYTGPNIGFALSINPDKTIGVSFLGGLAQNSSPKLLTPKIWNNLIIVFDGKQSDPKKRVSVYLDGSFVEYIGNDTAPSFIGHLANRTVIGASVAPFAWPETTHIVGGFFMGELDDVRIYKRTLTQYEITYVASH